MDRGISEAQAQPGTPSHTAATDPNSYSSTGAAPTGSQYSTTGVFSTSHSDNNNNSSNNNSNTGNENAGVDGGGASGSDNSSGAGVESGVSDWNTGGLIPPPNMGKRAQDIPNPILKDPLADYFRR